MTRKGLGPAVGGLLLPAVVFGSGFSLYENGARGLGMAGAYTAAVDDASGIFFNPAALAGLERGDLVGGASLIFVSRKFAGESPFPGEGVLEESPDEVFVPFHVYWGHPVTRAFSLGFGVYTPFGLSVEWRSPETFTGRFVSTKAAVTPVYFNPVAAVSLGESVRLGAGLMAVHASVDLNRNVGITSPAGPDPDVLDLGIAELSGDNGLDYGVNAGIQVDLGKRLTLGANFRSGIPVTYEGRADFTFQGSKTGLDPQLRGAFPDSQGVTTEVTFPAVAVLAVAYRAGRVTVEGDLGWTEWSTFDALRFDFEDDDLDAVRDQRWEDSLFFRLGGEVALGPETALRLGYYYDETPQRTEFVSPILPDNSRHGVSAGFGKRWDRVRADLYGMWLFVGDRSTEGINTDGFDGTYANSVGILGLTFGVAY